MNQVLQSCISNLTDQSPLKDFNSFRFTAPRPLEKWSYWCQPSGKLPFDIHFFINETLTVWKDFATRVTVKVTALAEAPVRGAHRPH